jgi:hypothetical protein
MREANGASAGDRAEKATEQSVQVDIGGVISLDHQSWSVQRRPEEGLIHWKLPC